jgi:hypothetical protein
MAMPSQKTRVMTGFQEPTPMKSLVKVCNKTGGPCQTYRRQ